MWPTFYLPGASELLDPSPLRDSADLNCDPTESGALRQRVVLDPTVHLTNSQVGDLAVVLLIQNYASVLQGPDPCSLPTGWKWFMRTGSPGWHVQYKFLEAADLAGSTTWFHRGYHASGGNGYICAHIWTFRNANPDHPLDDWGSASFQNAAWGGVTYARGAGGAGPVFIYDNYQWLMDIIYYGIGGAAGDDFTNLGVLGNTTGDGYKWDHVARDYFLGNRCYIHAKPVRGYFVNGKNLIEGETLTSTLTNWTQTQMTRSANVGMAAPVQAASITQSNSSLRGYMEYEVTLTAGKPYTFNMFGVHSSTWDGSPVTLAQSIVTPSNAEFGGTYSPSGRNGGYYNDTAGQFGAGRGTWWDSAVFTYNDDGIPSTGTDCASIWFIAQESGVHKLRIGLSDVNGDPTDPVPAGTTRQVAAVSLYEGYVACQWTPSGVTESGRAASPFYWFDDAGSVGVQFWQSHFGVVRAGSMPPARMHPLYNEVYGAHVEDDGLTVSARTFQYCDDPVWIGADCNRLVYPTIGGVAKKYYAEFTVGATVGGGPAVRIGLKPLGNSFPNVHANPSDYGYSVAVAPGDKLGIALDFSAGEIKFYKNGVQQGATTTGIPTDLPFELGVFTVYQATVSGYVDRGSAVTCNLRGPFTHKPVGFNAWDIHNELT